MSKGGKKALGVAAEQLRQIALAVGDGELIGSEEALIGQLGVSRSTVRQVARVLEREGVLRVKRGPYGGYFSARPDAKTIETAVGTYLMFLDFEREDVTHIASALWVEVARKAARSRSEKKAELVAHFREQLRTFDFDTPWATVSAVDGEYRKAIMELANSKYVELIFQINMSFATRTPNGPDTSDDPEADHAFPPQYRDAKLLELSAIEQGDEELAALAAAHARKIWHARIWFKRRNG